MNHQTDTAPKKPRRFRVRWTLVAYDGLILLAIQLFFLAFYNPDPDFSLLGVLLQILLSGGCIFFSRIAFSVYQMIWRYGGIQSYIRLFVADTVGSALYVVLEYLLPSFHVSFDRQAAICAMNLLGSLGIRMMYRYAYKFGNSRTGWGRLMRLLLFVFSGAKITAAGDDPRSAPVEDDRVSIAIVGAGSVGISLAQELLSTASGYRPCCFIDVDSRKVGRKVLDIQVLSEDGGVFDALRDMNVQEVVFAIPNLPDETRKALYDRYLSAGFRIKKYDYPLMESAGGKRQLREFDIEELLFRKSIRMNNEATQAYYRGKVILITGGGGSIGSEIARQIAKMQPRKLVLLDIYENGVYDVQQELRLAYGNALEMQVEIASITHKSAMERVFRAHRPDVVINAAAHKHVPLMEHNCIEAVWNNVFGTQNLVELCEEYGCGRFMMVSTDKAVNPTNVMGATKRMCEMIVQSASTWGRAVYSATRFGNVLGSAGSVIPLFKRQIANGGPITLTDNRIIRYFMTIPEASMLVLESGAMARNGELFVLDMGQPVQIRRLAESMIRLSGARNIQIIETGLRPGEKLYEELLVKTEELERTENKLIFIERETPLTREEVAAKLAALHEACDANDDEKVKETLHRVVPTYRTPEEVNAQAEKAREMELSRGVAASA